MKLEIDIPEHHYNNIIALDSVSLGRVPYKGIIMYAINAIKRGKALEQEPTTKNDLGVDLISRADAIKAMQEKSKKLKNLDTINGLCGAVAILYDMPSATPQEPQSFEWCDTCKEYDQEKHCCHRWSKVIRDTIEEMKQEQEPKTGHWVHGEYCSECGCDVPAYIIDWKWQKDMDAKYCPNCGAKMVEPQEREVENGND